MRVSGRLRVFISYARADTVRLDRFVPALRAAGCVVKMDKRDALTTYQNLAKTLENAIQISDVMVVTLSPAAVDSSWVRREIRLGLSLGKPIIPVVVRAVELPKTLKHLQVFDLHDAEEAAVKAAQLIGAINLLTHHAAHETEPHDLVAANSTKEPQAPDNDTARRLLLV